MSTDFQWMKRLPVWALLAVAIAWAGLVVAGSWPAVAPLTVLPPLALALLALALLPLTMVPGQAKSLVGVVERLAAARGEAEALEAVLARLEAGLDVAAARTNTLAGELRGSAPALGGQVAALAGHVTSIAGESGRMQEALAPVLGQLEASAGQIRAVEALLDRVHVLGAAATTEGDAALCALSAQLARVDAVSRETTEAVAKRAYALDAAVDGVMARADIGMADVAARLTALLGRLDSGLDGAGRQLMLLGDEGVRQFVQRLDSLITTSKALEAAMAGHGLAADAVASQLAGSEATAARLGAPLAVLAAEAEALGAGLGARLSAAEATLATLAERGVAVAEMGSTLAAGESRLISLASALEAELGRAHKGLSGIENAAERLAPPLEAIVAAVAATEERLGAVEARFTRRERSSLARDAQALMTRLGSDTAELAGLLQLPVPEAIWQDWLRGDRTTLPRNVRALLGEADQRKLARHLAHDPVFRVAGFRFLDGFEAMLARLLEDRDGEALAATLLSGDFGALYMRLGEAAGRLPE
jgi:hypothetical protein